MVQIVKLLIRVLRRQFLTTMVLQAFFSAQMVLLGEQLGHAVVLVTQDMVMMDPTVRVPFVTIIVRLVQGNLLLAIIIKN